jgi:alpha-tubulin suppressor-like RCC1 family protein
MKSIKCPDRITQVYTKDRFTLAISDNGKAYNCGFVASSERRLHHLTQLTLPKDVGPILRGAVSSDSAVLITSRNEVLAFGNVAKPGMVLMDVTMAPRVYIVRNKYVEKLVENFKTKREYKLRVRMSEDVTILFFALSNVELQIALTFR